MIRSFIITCSLICSLQSIAQSYYYLGNLMGLSTLHGTARYVGSGGIMGSVGSDASTLSTNPAAIGTFSRSEFAFSPTLQVNNVESQYAVNGGYGNSTSSFQDYTKIKFVINNASIIFANRRSDTKTLRASNFGIAVNRTANFNNKYYFGGINGSWSYSNYLANDLNSFYQLNKAAFPSNANAVTVDDMVQYGERFMGAYGSGLLYKETNRDIITDPVVGLVIQDGVKETSGGITELSFAWAGNFKDKFYLGASLGVPFLNLQTNTIFSEEDKGQTNLNGFAKYTMSEQVTQNGTGVNLKLGGLYKVNKELKLSGYFHTPTIYSINENYTINYTTFYNSSNQFQYNADELTFTMYSPLKAGLGFSYLVGRMGFVGAEYEFSNNGGVTVDFTNSESYSNVINNGFRAGLQSTHTLKIGGELAIDNFRLRAGYQYRTSPYQKSAIIYGGDMISRTYTAGIGYRGKNASIDFAYMRNYYDNYASFYDDRAYNDYGIRTNNTSQQFVLTFNYRFN